jgi:predicted site-specific integrase-resolvase
MEGKRMPTRPKPSKFVSAKEFARTVGIATITAWKWMGNGKVRTGDVAGRNYILRSEIARHRAERMDTARNRTRGKA